MKISLYFFLLLLIPSCNTSETSKTDSQKVLPTTSKEQNKNEAERLDSILALKMIKPTFSTSLDSLKYFTKELIIRETNKDETFRIHINDDIITPKNLVTINDVWSGKDSVFYANEITFIQYYKGLNLLLLQLDFTPCTGLGCSVNYQLLYNTKSKKVYPFGRFRTGFDMGLYSIQDNNYYLSKTFHGRNAELKDTIFYQLYNLIDLFNNNPEGKTIARLTFEKENYDIPTSIKVEEGFD